MYPVDCYDALNEHKLEAIKYYIDLNKAYLKEISKEEYELFSEYMKGSGKDVLIKLLAAQTDEEMNDLVAIIDTNLSYGGKLKGKSFEQKLQVLYRQFAMLTAEKKTFSLKEALKEQRELAALHDQTNDICNEYRDAVNNQRYVKDTMNQPLILEKLVASKKQTKEEFKRSMEALAETTSAKTKEARKRAFKMLREYNVRDAKYQLQQQKNEMQR